MMKIITIIILSLAIYSLGCSKSDSTSECLKGKMVINGICGNITLQVLSGNIDTNLIVKSWVDPSTSKTYENVFALKSVCTFPTNIKEGDEFYFKINNDPKGNDCPVCLAYRPTPPKGLMISICK